MPIKKNHQERLCRHLDYKFSNEKLLKKALTHRSAANIHNERLEFLGDAILGMVIAEELFKKFPKSDEGKLSRLRSSLVKGKTLTEVALEIKLGDCLYLGEGELKTGGNRRSSILADAFEAVLGAIYLDSSFSTVKETILQLFSQRLDEISLDSAFKDPKTLLQELLQSRKYGLPEYELTEVIGEAHEQEFRVKCSVEELKLTTKGKGTSRRNAEQQAAEKLLAQIEKKALIP